MRNTQSSSHLKGIVKKYKENKTVPGEVNKKFFESLNNITHLLEVREYWEKGMSLQSNKSNTIGNFLNTTFNDVEIFICARIEKLKKKK